MQSAGSIYTTAGIVLIDVIQNVVSMWRLHHHINGFYSLKSVNGTSPKSLDLMVIIAESCKNPKLLETEYWQSLQDTADVATVSVSNKSSILKHSGIPSRNRITPKDCQAKSNITSISKVAVKPVDHSAQESTNLQCADCNEATSTNDSEREHRTLMLKRSLQLLRRTEFLLLVEYIECAIPVLYIAYLPILCQFQNRKYYPEVTNQNFGTLSR